MFMQGLTKNSWCRSTQASLHGSLNLFVNFSGIDAHLYCNGRQSWTGVGRKIREELQGAALDALSLRSIWSRSRNNESGVKSQASRKRGVRTKLFEEQHFTHLYLRTVEPAMVRPSVDAQTMLHQPGTWHEHVRSEVDVRCHQRGHVAHCQVVVPERVRGDVRRALMYTKRPLQSPYCVASSLAAADAAREEASAIARDVRASVERAIARMSLTLRLSYICATARPCGSPVAELIDRAMTLKAFWASGPQPPVDSATIGTSLTPWSKHLCAVCLSANLRSS